VQAWTSNKDDLEEALQQNLKLRRELGAEVAKASDSSAKQMGRGVRNSEGFAAQTNHH
jgi:hypothetical protein